MEPLLTTALQGTARHPGSALETGMPVDALLADIAGREPERTLLLAAGAMATYLQAGQQPETNTAPLAPSPADTLPAVEGRQARLVWDLLHQRFPPVIVTEEFMLQGGRHSDLEYQAVLAEALVLTQRAGCRLPERMLPKALVAQDPAVRAALLPVLGERGRWLAGLNPAWKWATAEPEVKDDQLEIAWQEGRAPQRLAALARLRASDPATARQWLATSWKSEGAEFRHDALCALETGLSLEDEPFLEAALDDRGERVRVRAAQLLARLTDSALAIRMRERAGTILSYDQTRERLVAALPERIDTAWQRDGVVLKPPKTTQVDERAWWTIQTLALVPPTYWSARFNRTPNNLVAAAIQSEGVNVVLEGWARAAMMFRDDAWLEPLWTCWQGLQVSERPRSGVQQQMLNGLLAHMSSTQAEQCMAAVLVDRGIPDDPFWGAMLQSLPRPWGHALSSVCLDRLHSHFTRIRNSIFYFTYLDTIAAALAPACFSEAHQLFKEIATYADVEASRNLHKPFFAALDRFAEIIQVRRMLYDEFHILRPA